MRRALLACSIVVVLAGHALQWWTLPGLQRVEWWLYDARMAAWANGAAQTEPDEPPPVWNASPTTTGPKPMACTNCASCS